MLSSGLFPGVCRLNANVSEHSVWSIFIGEYISCLFACEDGTECSETLAFKLQTPVNNPEENIRQPFSLLYVCNFMFNCELTVIQNSLHIRAAFTTVINVLGPLPLSSPWTSQGPIYKISAPYPDKRHSQYAVNIHCCYSR
jgi:hypothetical protein